LFLKGVNKLAILAKDGVHIVYKWQRYKKQPSTLVEFENLSLNLNDKALRFYDKGEGLRASISTNKKRVEIPLNVDKKQYRLLARANPFKGVLIYQGSRFFLHIYLPIEAMEALEAPPC